MLSICDYFAMRDYNIMVIKTTAGDITELKKVVEKNKADGVILTRAIEDGLNKLRKDKVHIPEDIRIASFYNSSLLDGYYPSVSCLKFDIEELGMTASKMLLDTMNGSETPGKIVLGYKVILKDSKK